MTSSNQRSLRILQVVGGMVRGGIETWLTNVLRHIDRESLSDGLFSTHRSTMCLRR